MSMMTVMMILLERIFSSNPKSAVWLEQIDSTSTIQILGNMSSMILPVHLFNLKLYQRTMNFMGFCPTIPILRSPTQIPFHLVSIC